MALRGAGGLPLLDHIFSMGFFCGPTGSMRIERVARRTFRAGEFGIRPFVALDAQRTSRTHDPKTVDSGQRNIFGMGEIITLGNGDIGGSRAGGIFGGLSAPKGNKDKRHYTQPLAPHAASVHHRGPRCLYYINYQVYFTNLLIKTI